MKNMFTAIALSATLAAGTAFADGHADLMVKGADQDMSGGTVTAEKIIAKENGWMVVHKTADGMKPGPVIGYSPVKAGENMDVTAILTEPVNSGEKVMLMLHSEQGGMTTGAFEYTLGAKEDGPIKVADTLIMVVVSAQ